MDYKEKYNKSVSGECNDTALEEQLKIWFEKGKCSGIDDVIFHPQKYGLEKQNPDISSFPKEQQVFMKKYTSVDKITLIKLLAERDANSAEIIESFEKQGEQKKSYDTCVSSMMDNKKSPYGEKRDFGYFEEKSALSEEDEDMFQAFKNTVIPQPKQEWDGTEIAPPIDSDVCG